MIILFIKDLQLMENLMVMVFLLIMMVMNMKENLKMI